MNAKNDPTQLSPLTKAQAVVDATAETMRDAEVKFYHALEWFKTTIAAHAKAEITLTIVEMDQRKRDQQKGRTQ